MKTRVTLLFVIVLLASPVMVSAEPAAGIPTGVWEGFITGSEMGTAGGVVAQKARLTIKDDGTWTMTTAAWQASGTVQARGRHLVLDGNFVAANPGNPLGRAVYDLSSWGNQNLGGSASAQFNGLHITTGVQFKKVQ